jgi:uncharacterized damage-inducible protein DinB
LFLSKLEVQIETLQHLITMTPDRLLDWQPAPEIFRTDELLGHLLECLAGFCAALQAARPTELVGFERLRSLEVNHRCGTAEAAARIADYQARIREGFEALTDADLSRRIPTVFNQTGEAVFTLLLSNFEHLVNHKHQLFQYLKLAGVKLNSRDLYHFEG